MRSYPFFQPAQQEDSNPSITEYSGNLKLTHDQNSGDEYGAWVNHMCPMPKVLKF
jgi:outer membrane phospholipase A